MVFFASLFLACVAAAALSGKLSIIVAAGYAVSSIVTFAAYARDKSAARNCRWRTRESTLHLLSLAGGWPGAAVAQRVIHHKSRKQPFLMIFRGSVIANCAALLWFACAR